jgi:ectoine hydroxylase-related dioxygenase (phytanoyl-CoA dioxygenase family)
VCATYTLTHTRTHTHTHTPTARVHEFLDVSDPTFLYSYKGFPVKRQHFHMDNAFGDGVYCVLYSPSDDVVFLWRQHGKEFKVVLKAGDMLLFHSNLEHAGFEYPAPKEGRCVRLSCSVCAP